LARFGGPFLLARHRGFALRRGPAKAANAGAAGFTLAPPGALPVMKKRVARTF